MRFLLCVVKEIPVTIKCSSTGLWSCQSSRIYPFLSFRGNSLNSGLVIDLGQARTVEAAGNNDVLGHPSLRLRKQSAIVLPQMHS